MGIIKDPKSWRAGFELGLAGFSFPYSKPRKPTAYLYNGIRLPALPEWDREKYPYAVISNADGWGGCRLFVLTTISNHHVKLVTTVSGVTELRYFYGVGCRYVQCICDEKTGMWSSFGDEVEVFFEASHFSLPIWANFDLLNEDGTVNVATSDPVPVYEYGVKEWIY